MLPKHEYQGLSKHLRLLSGQRVVTRETWTPTSKMRMKGCEAMEEDTVGILSTRKQLRRKQQIDILAAVLGCSTIQREERWDSLLKKGVVLKMYNFVTMLVC